MSDQLVRLEHLICKALWFYFNAWLPTGVTLDICSCQCFEIFFGGILDFTQLKKLKKFNLMHESAKCKKYSFKATILLYKWPIVVVSLKGKV